MMLSVQTMIGSVGIDRRNGSSHRRYHGYTTGAHKSDPAIGQAKAPADNARGLTRNQEPIRKTGTNTPPARNEGAATPSSLANPASFTTTHSKSTHMHP